MSSSDRGGGGGNGQRGKTARSEPEPEPVEPEPVERSVRGRIVIRSSSHPPGEPPPPAGVEPEGFATPPKDDVRGRRKRDTPAERPRKRREERQATGGHPADRGDAGAARPSGWRETSTRRSDARGASAHGTSSKRTWVALVLALVAAAAITALLLRMLSP